MKTTDQIIDEIILKSPHGSKLWKQRLKKKYSVQDEISQDKDSKENDESVHDHPNQFYFNFEDEL